MRSPATIEFATQFNRLPVIELDSGERLGHVTDAVVDPVSGRLLGITMRARNGAEPAIATSDLTIANDAIIVAEAALCEKSELQTKEGTPTCMCSELLGASVVTDQGNWVGRVVEIHISVARRCTVYRVVESGFQAFWGRSFFIPGNAPRAYSRGGARLIVPDAKRSWYSATSPAEVIDQCEMDQKGVLQ